MSREGSGAAARALRVAEASPDRDAGRTARAADAAVRLTGRTARVAGPVVVAVSAGAVFLLLAIRSMLGGEGGDLVAYPFSRADPTRYDPSDSAGLVTTLVVVSATWWLRRPLVEALRRFAPWLRLERDVAVRGTSPSGAGSTSRRIAPALAGPSRMRAFLAALWSVAILLLPPMAVRGIGILPPSGAAPSVVVVYGLAVTGAFLHFGLTVLPRIWKGRWVVAWPRVPAVGETAEFHVGTTDGGARIDGLRVLLRCVREPRAEPVARPEILFVREAVLPSAAAIGPGSDLRVRVAVPRRCPASDSASPVAVYWEVVVLGRVGAHDFADCVLVPVSAAAPPTQR